MTEADRFAAMAAARYGCRCTTVLIYDGPEAVRVYSSDPAFVPATGRKRFDAAPAMAQMRAHGVAQRIEGTAQIRAMFADADKLLETGYLCIVNLPLHDAGQMVGQVNLTLPEGRVDDLALQRLTDAAQGLAQLARKGPVD